MRIFLGPRAVYLSWSRPRKQHKRPGARNQLNLTIHLGTWLAFQQWCKVHGKIASEEIEEFMARTAASASQPTAQPEGAAR